MKLGRAIPVVPVFNWAKKHFGKFAYIAVLGLAFNAGATYKNQYERFKLKILHWENPYSEESPTGPIEVADVENDQGDLEKSLVNTETMKILYEFDNNYMPRDTGYTFNALTERTESADREELKDLYNKNQELKNTIEEKLCKDIPLNPDCVDPTNFEYRKELNAFGELEPVLRCKEKKVILTKDLCKTIYGEDKVSEKTPRKYSNVDNPNVVQVNLETSAEGQDPNQPEQSKQESGGNGVLIFSGLAALGGAGWKGYKYLKP